MGGPKEKCFSDKVDRVVVERSGVEKHGYDSEAD